MLNISCNNVYCCWRIRQNKKRLERAMIHCTASLSTINLSHILKQSLNFTMINKQDIQIILMLLVGSDISMTGSTGNNQ